MASSSENACTSDSKESKNNVVPTQPGNEVYKIDLYLGKFYSKDLLVSEVMDTNKRVIMEILPTELKSIDNNLVQISINTGKVLPITKAIERYTVERSIADYSSSPSSTVLYISDMKYSYGQVVSGTDVIHLSYLETDGYLDVVDLNKVELALDTQYVLQSVMTKGANADSAEKVKYLMPFYYTTQRAGINEFDIAVLAMSHSLIKDASCEKDNGTPFKYCLNS